jgi:hypothetical protein
MVHVSTSRHAVCPKREMDIFVAPHGMSQTPVNVRPTATYAKIRCGVTFVQGGRGGSESNVVISQPAVPPLPTGKARAVLPITLLL